MKCPQCNGSYLQVHGSFSGWQKIDFTGDGLEVVDSNPTDFDWLLDNTVECLECGHTGTAEAFHAHARKAEE